MSDTFYNLDKAKRQKIINASLLEFASHGFSRSSTNRIVQEAGIGKGMLFYYFENKAGLFKFLVDYCLEFIERYYFEQIDMDEKDIFKRLVHQTRIKSDLFTMHPSMSQFLSKVVIDKDNFQHITEGQKEYIVNLQNKVQSQLFNDIDTSLFRDDLDVNQSVKIIQFSIAGLSESIMARVTDEMINSNDYSIFYEEFDAYINEMRKIFYKGS